jgi:hypothetical protein
MLRYSLAGVFDKAKPAFALNYTGFLANLGLTRRKSIVMASNAATTPSSRSVNLQALGRLCVSNSEPFDHRDMDGFASLEMTAPYSNSKL